MNVRRLLITINLAFISIFCLQGQASYDIQMVLNNVDCQANRVCYDVQLRSSSGSNWNLAGQNYRLYYDASLGAYHSGVSLLGGNYQDFDLVQNSQNNDASGTGSISFESTLSFLNYAIDLNNTSGGGSTLPSDGSWLSTSRLCFTVNSEVLDSANTCFEAIWARENLTNAYATSFVEVSQWVQTDMTQMANGNMYNDLDSSDGESSCFTSSCAESGMYDIRMSLNNVDCQANRACFDVQLRSNNGESWGLAGQNYRLYYDASLGSYHSGVSLLGNTNYGAFNLNEDIQHQNAMGTGGLSFEDSLSFLNYSIDLSNTGSGGVTLSSNGTWLTTSQLCFNVNESVLNDPNTCFEAVWGRSGLTNNYATSFVEVAEWVSTDSTRMGEGVNYNDLGPQDACFAAYAPVYDTTHASICAGDVYTFGGNNYTVAGLYNDTLARPGGCDSIQTLALNIIGLPTLSTRDTTLCEGTSLNLPLLVNSSASLDYYRTLADANNGTNAISSTITLTRDTTFYVRASTNTNPICYAVDSIQMQRQTCGNYDLALRKTLAQGQASTVAPGDTVVFNLTIYNQGNLDVTNFQLVEYLTPGLDYINSNIANPQWFQFGTNNPGYLYQDTLVAQDSVQVPVKFIVNAGFTGSSLVNAAEISAASVVGATGPVSDEDSTPDSSENNDVFGGDNIIDNTSSDEDDHDRETIYTCATQNTSLTQSICQGNTYVFNGQNLTTSGVYRDTMPSANNCDSIITLNLTVLPISNNTNLNRSICQGNTYNFNGQSLTTGGVYRDTMPGSNGCDSIITLNLTVLPISNNTNLNQSICQGNTYNFNGQSLTTGGVYRDTMPSANGCDSIITLNLTVLPISNNQIRNHYICEGGTYNFNGQILTAAGSYRDSLKNSNGCDSIIVLNLTEIPISDNTNLNRSICQGNTYNFNGQNLTTSGVYKDTLPSTDGCDSIITLNLTVSATLNYNFNHSICQGNTYNFHGQTITTGGIYRDTVMSSSGCDSVVTLNLSILPISNNTNINQTICQGSVYNFNGQNLTTGGVYRDTMPSSNGCDSIITLNLAVAPRPVLSTRDTLICPSSNLNLNTLISQSTGTISFHQSLNDANNGTNAVSNNIITANNATYYVRATAASLSTCYSVDSIAVTRRACNFDLALTKKVKPSQAFPIKLGDTIAYSIGVYNQGNAIAYNIGINDSIGAGLTYLPALNTGWTTVVSGGATYLRRTFAGPLAVSDSVFFDINLVVDTNYTAESIINIAEIAFADDDQNSNNTAPNDGDSTPGNNREGEDDRDTEVLQVGRFDLALTKSLANGQSDTVKLGDDVFYDITVKNEGNFPVKDIEIRDNLPKGMIVSGIDNNNWTVNGGIATKLLPNVLQPGDSVTVQIVLRLIYGDPNGTVENIAEVEGATDIAGNQIEDADSNPGSHPEEGKDITEDDEDNANAMVEAYDPIGYIYCDKTGLIMSGGKISLASGPVGGSIFFAINPATGDTLDGRTGYYQFFTNGVPGVYTITYSRPDGIPMSTTILPQGGAFDPTGKDGNPTYDKDGDATNGVIALGENKVGSHISNITAGANPYYLSFNLETGDPFINLNNIPISCTFISSIVCEDRDGNGQFNTGVDGALSGVTVHLYDCADTLLPIASTITGNNGTYSFDGLSRGCYKVQFVLPTDFYIPIDNGVVGQNGWSRALNLDYGACDTTTTVCMSQCPTITTTPRNISICEGATVQLSTSVTAPNATYSWKPSVGLNNPFIANPIASPSVSTVYIVEVNPGLGACLVYDTVRVNVNQLPEPDFSASLACAGTPTQFTNKTASSPTIISTNWDFGDGTVGSTEQNPTHTYQNGGQYNVKLIVQTSDGCVDSIWKSIMVAPSVTALATAQQDTICVGECVELLAQGGSSFAWNASTSLSQTNISNPIACPITTTTYTVNVTNDYGCVATASVQVVVIPGPTIDVSMTDITECGKFDGTITVNATGAANNYEYSIDGGLTFSPNPVFTNLPASSYLVVVKSGTCEVPYPNNPVVVGSGMAPSITSVPTVNPSCGANDGQITINANGGNNLLYSINGGINWSVNNEFLGLDGGTYYVAVATADRSCITYYPPIVLVKPQAPTFADVRHTDPSDCGLNDGTITIIAAGTGAIEYGLDNGVVTLWQSSNNFINLPAGSYDVYIRNAGNTCVTPYLLNSVVLQAPQAPSINGIVVNQPTDCATDDATITINATAGSAALEYSIDGGINWYNFATHTNLKAGTYNVFVRNANGTCEVAYADNPVEISYPEGAKITEVLHTNPSDCDVADGNIEITASGNSPNLIYSINGGVNWQLSSIFNNLSGGIYNIRVANNDTTCIINYPTLALEAPTKGNIDTVIVTNACINGAGVINITANGATALEYSIDNGNTYQASNNFLNVIDGTYHIRIRNANNSCEVIYGANPVTVTSAGNSNSVTNVATTNPSDCNKADGSITITATGNNLEFSINGGTTYQATGLFENLAAGDYELIIRHKDTGCEEVYTANPIQLTAPIAPVIGNIAVSNPTDCNRNDASINITASGNNTLEYSLDGTTWSNGSSFVNLLPGLYNVWVRNSDGSCAVPYLNNPVVITAPSGPVITDCQGTNPTDCNVDDGSFTIIASGGQGPLKYSIDGGTTWQSSNVFTGLAAGVYSIAVANEDETCRAIHPSCVLTAPEVPVIRDVIAVDPSDCEEDDGTISILADGKGGLEYSIDNGATWSGNSYFSGLEADTYQIRVRNAADNCEVYGGTHILTAPSAPQITNGIDNISICTGSSTPVSITMSEPIAHYTILGSGGYLNTTVNGNTLTFDAYLNGVVNNFIIVLENEDGCTVTEEFALHQTSDPEADFIVHNPICAATDVMVEFTGEASPGAILNWNLGGATIISSSASTNTAPAAAKLVVRWATPGGKTISLDINDGGCTDRKVQNINVNKLPFADAGEDVSICEGACTQLNGKGNGAIYQWSPATGLSATDIPNPVACPTVTTTYQLLVMGTEGCMVMDEVTVTVFGTISIDAGNDQAICEGETVQLNATGGTTYQWSPATGLSNPNIANPIANPSTTTTYTVMVTNEGGCTGEATVTITVHPKPVISAGADKAICAGENTMLSAIGGQTYSWSPAAGLSATNVPNPIASPTVTTTYTVVGTDVNGCTNTDQVTITVNERQSANAGPDQTVCQGSTIQLNASGGGTYQWSPTFGLSDATIANPTLTPIATTTYTVVVTSAGGCTSSDEVVITVNNALTANAGPDQTICEGQTAFLNASGGSNYTWSPATGLSNPNIANPTATPTVTTTYTVTVTDGSGCSDVDEVTITVTPGPKVVGCPDKYICKGGSVQLTVNGGVSWVWSPSAGLDNPLSPAPNASPLVTTTYTVTGTDANGCSSSDEVIVFVNGDANVNAGPDQTVCKGSTVQLNGSGSGTYKWSPVTGLSSTTIPNPTFTATATTTYALEITTTGNCRDTDYVTIIVHDLPVANAGADQTICQGASANLSASGGVTYAWSPSTGLNNVNIANPVATPTVTTTYTVTVTNAAGCTATDQVTINVNTPPVANAGADQTICTGESATLSASGGVTYVWSPSTGLNNVNIANPIATPTVTTTYTVTVTNAAGCTATDQVTINVNTPPVANAGADQTICQGASASLSASGGVTYAWSPSTGLNNVNIANPVATPTVTTTYTVTVTNAAGCTATDQVTINVNTPPVANAGPDQTICQGASATLAASGGAIYTWSPTTGLSNPNIANPIATPTVTTTYTVTVSNGDGCATTDQVTIFISTPPVANAGADQAICQGASATLSASGGVSYVWSPSTGLNNANISNPVAAPTVTTTYTVTVTDAIGCTATDAMTITVNPLPVANAGADQTICLGSSASLTASGGVSYVWSPSTGLNNPNISNPVANPTVTITYTVTVTDARGCTATDQVTVNVNTPPVANAGADQTICIGESATLSASGGTTYTWSPTIGLNNANISNPVATPTVTTTYTVTVSNGDGCTSTDQVTINVSTPPVANAGPDQTICDGTSTNLSASGGTTYLWSPSTGLSNLNIANPVANPTTTTTYTVTVTNEAGCTATDQVVITVMPKPEVIGCVDKEICKGDSIQLVVSGGDGMSWVWSPTESLDDPSSGTPIAFPTVTTTYTVTGTDANGCSASDEIIVFVHEGPTANAGADQTICSGASATLSASGGVSYVWSPTTGLNNPNIANPVATPTVTTTYTVTVTDARGCTATDEVTVTINTPPVANAGADQTICTGASASLSASGGVTYAWSPATGLSSTSIANPVATPTVTTTYTVTVTDAIGCTATDEVIITVNPLPVANAGADQTICSGSSANLSASGGVTYAWSPATGLSNTSISNPVATPTVTTTYTVTVTDAAGCTATDEVTINVNPLPVADAGRDQTVCIGGNVTLAASGGTTYSWSPAASLSNATIANPIATPTNTTTYTVTVTNDAGCVATAQVTIFVSPNPIANAGADQTICTGASANLSASGGVSYVWSPTTGLNDPNIASPVATPNATTTYTVTVRNDAGCIASDEVTIQVIEPLTVVPTIKRPDCCDNNGSISLAVNGGQGTYTYNWTPNVSTTNSATNLASGDYKIVVTSSEGCEIIANITLEKDCECTPIATDREICIEQGDTVGQICLPVKLDDIDKYEIKIPGATIVPNHGCDFENLTAYSYSLLPGVGNDGPYKIDNWTINGVSHEGMINNMTELTAWMNSVDPTGNWSHNAPVLIIMGGNPSTTYGDLTLTHQATWIETILNPNITGVAKGTLVEVPIGSQDSIIVTITHKETCCTETVVVKRCNTTCTEDIIAATQSTVNITDCNANGKVCLEIPLDEISKYDVKVGGTAYSSGFVGCDFDTLYAYTYFTMPDRGGSGPYRLRSWVIGGETYTGNFNNLQELINLMNGWDTDGNWQQDSTTLTLEGGVPANKYGAMDIEQINTGAFAILELNSNLIPKGTELALPKGTHDIVITNKATQCIDRLMVEVVCNESPKVECDDFISKSSETHNIVLCEDVINFCVEIPMDQLGSYSIEHNGSIYTGDIAACADNPSAIQLTVGKGKHEFTFTNELTGCADEIVIKVNCMQVDGNKAPISKNNSIMGPVKGQSVKQSARILVANSDETRTMMNEAKVINILANDRAAKENSNIRIIEQPQLGTLEMNSDNSITYHPKENYCNAKRADYFRYEICNGEVCDEAEVKVYIDCTPIKVYTGVSPNQDGINDYFKIDGLEVYPQNELRIYNRFGKLLISKKNYKNDWDGRVNGKILPSGTYFYKLDDGNGKQYSGFLQLNR